MRGKKDITRRQFLKGAGAAAMGAAAMGLLGGCSSGAEKAAVAGGGDGPAETAAPGETRRSVLAFASDQHAETPGFAAWLADQKAVYGEDLVHLSFAGDICDKTWVPEVFEGFRAVLEGQMPGQYHVTTGNQENKPGAPGAAGWDDLGHPAPGPRASQGLVRCRTASPGPLPPLRPHSASLLSVPLMGQPHSCQCAPLVSRSHPLPGGVPAAPPILSTCSCPGHVGWMTLLGVGALLLPLQRQVWT